MKTATQVYQEVHNKYGVSGGKADRYDIEAMETYANQFKWIEYVGNSHPENHSRIYLVLLDTGEYDIAYWDDTLEWMIDGNSHQKVVKYKSFEY